MSSPSQSYPYIDLSAPLNYSESGSGDIDAYTAYTDISGNLAHYAWVMNQVGANVWSASLNSPSDSADVIQLSIPTGYAVDGYSLSITSSTINSSAFFDFGSISGNGFDDYRALSSFSSGNVVGSGSYSVTIGSGTNVLSYTLQLNMIKVNEAPTTAEDALYPTFYTGGPAVDLFDNVVITNEANQHITQLTLLVDGVAATDSEFLTIGGSDIHLVAGQSGGLGNTGVTFATTNSDGSIQVSLTMPANTTSATVQTLLDGMTYKNTSASPTLGDRGITLANISDDGGVAKTGQDTSTPYDSTAVTVAAPANAAPVVTTDSGSAAFVESGAQGASQPVSIDSGITVTDSDNATLTKATVSISTHFVSGQDMLLFVSNPATMADISGSYNASTGVLELTSAAHATLAQWQSALRSITYSNQSDNPDTQTRTISYVVNDGTSDSVAATRDVTVAATNDAPVVTNSGGSASFTEGNNTSSTPVAIDSGLTISDVDNTTLTSAQVSITGNHHAAEDILVFTNNPATMGNIDATYNAATGVLSLSSAGSTATLAQWQAALRSVTYTDSSDTPNTGARTITFQVNDGTADSIANTKSVLVTSVNDTPIATTSGGPTAFTESSAGASTPVVVDSGITLSDVDSSTLASAVVSITGNFRSAEDLLSFTNNPATMGNISAIYNSATGIMSLNSSGATATVAQWEAALRSVTYTDTSDAPTTASRTIAFTANDGSSSSASVQKVITIAATNDAPVVTATSGTTAFTSGNNSGATPVAIDIGLSVNDPDNATLTHATVSISQNFKAGEDVLSFVNTSSATFGNIAATFNAATGEMEVSSAGGTATLAQWQAALRSVTYVDTAVTPDTSARTISFKINDGQLDSAVVTKTVSVVAVDNSPILQASGGVSAFVEGNNVSSTPVIIDSGINVGDVDSSSLRSANVTITNVKAGDTLAFTGNSATVGDITAGAYDANTGELALSSAGGATLAQWQAALRSVSYSSSSESPDTSSRSISLTVNDGSSDSAPVLKVVTVEAVNDTPVVAINGLGAAFVEDNNVTSTPVVIANGLIVTDLDNSRLASAVVSITDNLHSAEDALSFTNNPTTMGNISGSYNTLTGVLSLDSAGATATLTEWQAALRSVTYTNSSDSPSLDTRTVSVTVNDGTEDSTVATQTVTVTATNDAPVITLSASNPTFTEGGAAAIVNGSVVLSDADGSTLVSAKVSIAGFVAGEDKLDLPTGLPNIGDIVASFNAVTGELTLTSASPASLPEWEAALSAVTYENTSHAPTGTTRTLTFTVNDGNGNAGNSALVTQEVTVVSVNDAPDVVLGAATQSVRQNTPLVFSSANNNLIIVGDVDAGSHDVQVTLTASHGLLNLASSTGLTVTGDATDVVTVTGTLTAINSALNGLKFTPMTGYTGSALVDIAVNDLDASNPLDASTSVVITVTTPPPPNTPTNPPVTIDGVPVTTTQVTLPGGETGTSVSVGLTTSSRQDSTGDANTADINLVGNGASPLLVAKLPVGYGLTSVGGGVKLASNSAETLKAAIDAATANSDQAHQNVNGQHFLDKLAAGTSLLVNTITPVTASTGPTQAMELDGAGGSQHTALVIDTTQMSGKGSLVLNNVDFAAIVGATTVQGNTTGQTLTGDDASQSFIVNASDSFVFAGGGNDTLKITTFTAANNTVLQGGQGNDTVQFSGDRSQYTLEQHGGYTLVSNKDDPNQQVKVVNVENLGFADGVVSIPTNTQQTTLAALYDGLLGRQADVAGFDYWTQQSMSIGGIGLSILNSTEAGAKALNGDVSHDIAALYTAFFGRTVDTAGQAYWTEQVQQGHLNFVQVADSLLTSTEMTGHNKAPATWDFTV
ncbi:DUF4214 domain-containing protein [Pseudomonas sp. SLFW]|uniref:DUF4214 domain-containing protein n=1 Tax=Pseudomonas sp. SLFW TaxID=2683259 RepID=UPI001412F79B|nr:DUF4214 domain-containing protein [Pseudomonas sp. SLFW]NBB13548.1 DUF4214 domain-containing protein [Pseudomonas sp. SLFW]